MKSILSSCHYVNVVQLSKKYYILFKFRFAFLLNQKNILLSKRIKLCQLISPVKWLKSLFMFYALSKNSCFSICPFLIFKKIHIANYLF